MKIYLSVSNLANPNDVEDVKKHINQKIKNAEIIRWTKGMPYDPKIINKSDLVIVIPPSPFHSESEDQKTASVFLGKGNFFEATKAMKLKKTVAIAGKYRDSEDYLYMTEPFDSVVMTKENFQTNWGRIKGNLIPWKKFYE